MYVLMKVKQYDNADKYLLSFFFIIFYDLFRKNYSHPTSNIQQMFFVYAFIDTKHYL